MIKYHSSKAEVEKANREFVQKFGFPRVLGRIDETDILISEPNNNPHDNPHDYFSYKLKYRIMFKLFVIAMEDDNNNNNNNNNNNDNEFISAYR